MASYSLTDIEDVGILVQNNQKTVNGLYGRENLKYGCVCVCVRERERERDGERERERIHLFHSSKAGIINAPIIQRRGYIEDVME